MRGVPFEVVASRDRHQDQSIPRFVEAGGRWPTSACSSPRPAAKMITGQDIAVDGHIETFHIR